jgi:lysophospholipase L1-like esterase
MSPIRAIAAICLAVVLGAAAHGAHAAPAAPAAPAAQAAHAAGEFASVKPTPRVEYWQDREAAIAAQLRDTKSLAMVKLLFLGDSITDFWLLDDNPWVKGQKCGRKIWDESFAGSPPENRAMDFGISGDRIEHVLYRLLPRSAGGQGELDAPELDPEFIILLIGINNTWAAEDPEVDSIVAGIRAVLTAVHERKPKARIILQSLLPTDEPAKNREVVQPINQDLAELVKGPPFADFTSFLDLYPSFVDGSGRQISGYFNDGLHPSLYGYRIWRDRLVPYLKAARNPAPAAGRRKAG